MKPIQKTTSLTVLLLGTSLVSAVETILVDIQPGNNGPSIASDGTHFKAYDSVVDELASVNVYEDADRGNIYDAVGTSGSLYEIDITNNNGGGGFNAGSAAWTDQTPIVEGYFFSFGLNTVTISDLGSAFAAGEEITLTVFAIGDNLNQETTVTPSYGGIPLTAGSKSTVYNGVDRNPQDSGSVPSVQWKFPVDATKDTISFDWTFAPGASNTALNGFSISSAPPAYGTVQTVAVTPTDSTLLAGTPDVQLSVSSTFSTIGTVDTSSLPAFTSYSVAPAGVVEVSEFGLVSIVDAGTATLSVTVTGDTGAPITETIDFTVELPTSITATSPVNELYLDGGNTNITVTASNAQSFTDFPLNGLETLTFETDNPDVATVGFFNGIVSPGTIPGTATITASYPDGLGGQLTSAIAYTVASIPAKPTTLVHRYSFNNVAGPAAAATIITDSVGGQDGVVADDGAVSTGTALSFPGGAPASTAAYGSLPNGMISALPQATTFELWITIDSESDQERIFDFGSNTGGEDGAGTGLTYFNLVATNPFGGLAPSIGYTTNSNGGATEVTSNTLYELGVVSHFVVTYDSEVGVGEVYLDGDLIGSGNFPLGADLANLIDVNNYLGRSQWGGDPRIGASYDELRIYTGIMTPSEVIASGSAGPDAVIETGSNYATWAALQSLTAGVNDGPTQDPDVDGIANQLEFVLGGNPLSSDPTILPELSLTPTDFSYTFNRADESTPEITLIFQYGSDLVGWTDVAIGAVSSGLVSVDSGTPASNPDVITITVPRTGDKMFGRLTSSN